MKPLEREDAEDQINVELNFMKLVTSGKNTSGEALNKVLPRLEIWKSNMTIIEAKRAIFEKTKYIFEDEKKWTMDDEELNETVVLHIVDNLPFVKENSVNRKAICEFCEQRHGNADTCDIKIKGVSANTDEGSKKITLGDIKKHMKHERQLILGVTFKKIYGNKLPNLDSE